MHPSYKLEKQDGWLGQLLLLALLTNTNQEQHSMWCRCSAVCIWIWWQKEYPIWGMYEQKNQITFNCSVNVAFGCSGFSFWVRVLTLFDFRGDYCWFNQQGIWKFWPLHSDGMHQKCTDQQNRLIVKNSFIQFNTERLQTRVIIFGVILLPSFWLLPPPIGF